MSALTNVRAKNFLDAELDSGGSFTALTGARKLKLIATNGNETTAGTEISVGGSYAAGGFTVTFSAAANDGTAPQTYSAKKENVSVSQLNMPAVTTAGVEITDSAGTPIRSMWGALTVSRTTALGDTLSFPAASVVARA